MLTLRLARPADAAGVRAIYAPHVAEGFASFEAVVPDEAEVAARIARTLEQRPWLVGADGDAVRGYAYAAPHRERAAYQWCVECSVYVHPAAQGRGLGRALYTALHALLAAQGFVNAYAGITLPNPASVALHEAMGYGPVGVYRGAGFKRGAWRDVGWWQRRLAEAGPPGEPSPPVPLPALDPALVAETLRAGEALLRPA